MDAIFKYELAKEEIEKIEKYCSSVDYCSAEQLIGWNTMFHKSKNCYFYLTAEGVIKSFCQITENYYAAQISFGPVCCNKELMVHSLNEIILYYKRKHFYYLGIQLYFKSGFDLDYIEYQINKIHNVKYYFNSENTKTSLEINLESSIEDIFSNFSSDHRRSIRKALNLGATVKTINDDLELGILFDIFKKMYIKKKLPIDSFILGNKKDIYNYLITNNKGQILSVYDRDGVMLGGIISIYHGNTVRLYKATSDPERRDIPINYLLYYETIKLAKDANFKYLDLWGYNHFVDENHQLFLVNRFKKGFGGYFTFFAKKMNVDLIPFGTEIYRFLLMIRKTIKRLK